MGIYKYPLHREALSVAGLAAHLADQHDVLFKDNSALDASKRQSLKAMLPNNLLQMKMSMWGGQLAFCSISNFLSIRHEGGVNGTHVRQVLDDWSFNGTWMLNSSI